MRILIFLLILTILSCTGKTTKKKELLIVPSIDTLSLKSYLNNPIDLDHLSTIKIECTLLNTYETKFDRDRYKCCYILEKDTLATIISTKLKSNLFPLLETNGYETETFQCKDKKIPFSLGLGIGVSLNEFERQLGQFEKEAPGVYSKFFSFDERIIELSLEISGDQVSSISISASNKNN